MKRLRALSLLLGLSLWVVAVVMAQGTPLEQVDVTSGRTVFAAACAACHQVTGAGIPAAFPPLAGHVPDLLAREGGRRYLVDVVLFGLTGPISVAERSYDGLMPPWGHLSDAQVADVLNYVAGAWDNRLQLEPGFVAFTPAEVLVARGDAFDSNAVYAARESLGLE